MYVDDSAPTAQDMEVTPSELERQAGQFANLGDELRQHVGRGEVRQPMLGTSPPAMWMAARLAQLTGPDGAPGALRQWANGLAQLGVDERATATSYRNTDDGNAVTFRHLGTSVRLPAPGDSR